MAPNKRRSYSKMEETGTRNSYTSKQNTTILKHKWATTTTTTTKTPQNMTGKTPNPPTPLLAPVAHSVITWVPIGFGDPAPVACCPQYIILWVISHSMPSTLLGIYWMVLASLGLIPEFLGCLGLYFQTCVQCPLRASLQKFWCYPILPDLRCSPWPPHSFMLPRQ